MWLLNFQPCIKTKCVSSTCLFCCTYWFVGWKFSLSAKCSSCCTPSTQLKHLKWSGSYMVCCIIYLFWCFLHPDTLLLSFHICRKEETVTVYPADVVLFEGILMFYSQEIRDLFQMKLFVDTDADTRLSRRGVCVWVLSTAVNFIMW